MRELARWPLLLAAVVLVGAAVGVDYASAQPLGVGLALLGACCLGAFLYAEGARHREWWAAKPQDLRSDPTPADPGTARSSVHRAEGSSRHADE